MFFLVASKKPAVLSNCNVGYSLEVFTFGVTTLICYIENTYKYPEDFKYIKMVIEMIILRIFKKQQLNFK